MTAPEVPATNDPNLPEPCSDECGWCGENIPADERMLQAVFGIGTDSTLGTREMCNALVALFATELQKARAEGAAGGVFEFINSYPVGYRETVDELTSLRAKLTAVEGWQQSWSDSEDRLLLLPEASAELVAILRSQEPSTGQEQP